MSAKFDAGTQIFAIFRGNYQIKLNTYISINQSCHMKLWVKNYILSIQLTPSSQLMSL